MVNNIISFVIVIVMMNSKFALAKNTAELLDYPPDTKLLIIHADDIGMSNSTNESSFALLDDGVASSGSVMTPCPWINEAAVYGNNFPQYDLGVHTTLNSEWKRYRWGPVASRHLVKNLVDKYGYLWGSPLETLNHIQDLQEVETEITAQIEKALALGFIPSHIDSHMGTLFAHPELTQLYIKLAKKYNLIPMLVRWSEGLEEELTKRGLPAMKLKEILIKAEESNMILIDTIVTNVKGSSYEERKASYTELFKSIQPGLTQLIIHVSIDNTEAKNIFFDNRKETRRTIDHKIFTETDFKILIKDQAINLTNWKEISTLRNQLLR